jgi:hypothetical protein
MNNYPDFINVFIAIILSYFIYQAYIFRKIILIACAVVLSAYVVYLLYDKQKLTNIISENNTEIEEKTKEISNIKKALSDEDFNNTKSRGYSLNNPGNIRKSPNHFSGEVESDDAFKKFKSMKYGFRAMTALLHSYISNGHNTVDKILNRYAPSSDGNNPDKYAKSVIKLANVSRDQVLSTADFKNGNMLNIMYAMTRVEQGYSPNIHDLNEGYMMYIREIDINLN